MRAKAYPFSLVLVILYKINEKSKRNVGTSLLDKLTD